MAFAASNEILNCFAMTKSIKSLIISEKEESMTTSMLRKFLPLNISFSLKREFFLLKFKYDELILQERLFSSDSLSVKIQSCICTCDE